VLAAFSPSPTPFLVLMLVGFLVGTAGHLYRSKATIATGIGMILLATVLLPLGIYLADR
jgi:predicted benzoate:H+ symporter BenE